MRRIVLTAILGFCYLSASNPRNNALPANMPVQVYIPDEAIKIVSVIGYLESRGNHGVIGASGERGVLQYTKATWDAYCLQAVGLLLPQTEYNQKMVAAIKVEEWIGKRYTPQQIASIWNGGSINWEGKVGINKHGVKYNVPEYVQKFEEIYYGI